MLKHLTSFFFWNKEKQNNPTKKILITLFLLFLFRFGNTIPLVGIDQEALKKSFFQLENKNALLQLINMYSGGGGITILSPFSLGIIPYINASILIDLLTALFPFLEKLQSEEGELGRKKLNFYKKIVTFLFAIFQSVFLIFYLKPYFYDISFLSYFTIGLELVTGSFLIVWLTMMIDNKGIGNGTSLVIFTNIVVTLISKNLFDIQSFNQQTFLEIFLFFFLILLICISQTARINIDVVSARQLAYLENMEKGNFRENILKTSSLNESGLSIRFNQAGIFPIIIASNLLPFFSILSESLGNQYKNINTFFYYLLIIGFNYFYTIVFWDPEKISEQLRKASVSVVNVTPGKETVTYLENVVQSSSLLGGIFLCLILILYDSFKQIIGGSVLNQINISSLIILVGVAYEIQKNLRSLYRNTMKKEKIIKN
jgi:preprotein translocase subunit SecY